MSEDTWADTSVVWEYHQLRHPEVSADIGIVLGCHDIGVADVAAKAFHRGQIPSLVVTGATGPATRERFPDGEAHTFARRLREHGVPTDAVLIEPNATNTGQNITNSKNLLHQRGISPTIVALICMPYMERRAWATCKAQWPQVEPWCISSGQDLAGYLDVMWERDGMEPGEVIEMMIGDLQRIIIYPAKGFTVPQEVPGEVHRAYRHLVKAGYGAKLLPE